jgi:ketosteroid isomerase-like protein
MSENLDLVRSIYADWERGDFSSAEWADPETEYVFTDGPGPGSWTGLAQMAEAPCDCVSAWKDWYAGAEEYRELDHERVLVLLRSSGRGKTSGVEVLAKRGADLVHIRNGRIVRTIWYWDRERALADLGLEG